MTQRGRDPEDDELDERTFVPPTDDLAPEPTLAPSTVRASFDEDVDFLAEPTLAPDRFGEEQVDMTSINRKAPVQRSLPSIPDVELLGEIGRGGQGVVYRGRQAYLDRTVAVKVLSSDDPSGNFAKRFQREAKILAGLSHANIVTCHQAGLAPNGECFLVMEFIDGPNLRQWLGDHGPLDPIRTLHLGKGMAEALRHAQKAGVIHRDVKPENILLTPIRGADGGDPFPYRPKLADLGLARPPVGGDTNTDMNLTLAGAIVGTPSTMSPEQFDDPDNVDFRTDIYGLGCVLFHALTGEPAYLQKTITATITEKLKAKAPDASKLRPEVPRQLAKLVSSMLSRDRNDRPESYDALIDSFDQLLGIGSSSRIKPWFLLAALAGGIASVTAATLVMIGNAATLEPLSVDVVTPERASEGEAIALNALVPNAEERQVSFQWDQTNADSAPRIQLVDPSASKQLFEAPEASADYTLEFELTVREPNAVEPLTRAVTVQVSADDDAPTLGIISASEDAQEGDTIRLNATARDPEGSELTFEWSQQLRAGDPEVVLMNPSSSSPYFVAPLATQSYEVHLDVTARDASNKVSPVQSTRILVRAIDDSPVADAGGDRSVREGERITLSGSAIDSDSTASDLNLAWEQVGTPMIPVESSADGSVTFAAPRGLLDPNLRFRLTASDAASSHSTYTTIEVLPDLSVLSFADSRSHELFAESPGARLNLWTPQEGSWTPSGDSNDTAMGFRKRAQGTCQLHLPRESWRLAGSIRPVLSESRKLTRESGIQLEFADGSAIALLVSPKTSQKYADDERVEMRICRQHRDPETSNWVQTELLDDDVITKSFNPDVDWIWFEVLWTGQRVTILAGLQDNPARWHRFDAVVPKDWVSNAAPGTLAMFVDRGTTQFRRFVLHAL